MDRRTFLKSLILQASIFITTQNAYGSLYEGDKKEIIMTIDDGPKKTMKKILEELGSNGENPAIFYVVGRNLKNNYGRGLAKEALINGHLLGNHSYNHPRFSKITFENAIGEIERTEELIEKIHQEAEIRRIKKLFRFPYGDETKQVREYLKEEGYTPQRWDTDSNDWRHYSKSRTLDLVSILLNCKQVKNKDIILLHDLPITANFIVPFFVNFKKYKFVLPK